MFKGRERAFKTSGSIRSENTLLQHARQWGAKRRPEAAAALNDVKAARMAEYVHKTLSSSVRKALRRQTCTFSPWQHHAEALPPSHTGLIIHKA